MRRDYKKTDGLQKLSLHSMIQNGVLRLMLFCSCPWYNGWVLCACVAHQATGSTLSSSLHTNKGRETAALILRTF